MLAPVYWGALIASGVPAYPGALPKPWKWTGGLGGGRGAQAVRGRRHWRAWVAVSAAVGGLAAGPPPLLLVETAPRSSTPRPAAPLTAAVAEAAVLDSVVSAVTRKLGAKRAGQCCVDQADGGQGQEAARGEHRVRPCGWQEENGGPSEGLRSWWWRLAPVSPAPSVALGGGLACRRRAARKTRRQTPASAAKPAHKRIDLGANRRIGTAVGCTCRKPPLSAVSPSGCGRSGTHLM